MTDIDTRPLYEPVDENLENFRRRTFLKALGVSFAAFATPGCDFRKPTGKIVPYLVQEENALPGVATWYASTCGACPAQCGTLVKSRDGRPIKLEGNKENPISHGALCARGQASVLDLYDSRRNKNPGESANGESRSAVSWSDMDQTLQGHLSRINQQGGEIRILTPTLASPSREAALETFLKAFNSARHLVYDSLGAGSILQAHKASHGVARLPRYQFDKARVIVSLDADFLGTWLSPVEFAKGWSIGRRGATDGSVMSWHVQIESRMSLTGASADLRVPVRPSALKPIVIEIARKVSESLGVAEGTRLPHREGASPVAPDVIESIASRLIAARGRSLVVSGSADVDVQILANFLNHVLANYGRTLDLKRASLQYSDRGAGLGTLIDEMRSGRVKCLIVHEANPVFDHPRGEEFALALKQVPITISMSRTPDETSELMRFSCPDHNPLEGWADAHPQTGVYSLFQPTVAPIFETRSCIESWLTWAGQAGSAYDFLRKTWRDRVFQLKPADPAFNGMWEKAVHDGFHLVESEALDSPEYRPRSLVQVNLDRIPTDTGDFELVTYPTVALGSGAQALNPWLQELPDPVSKVSWGHHASMSLTMRTARSDVRST